jgi:NAD-dependent dihydropyrimidine dehydrogenase PreA subunit
MPPIIDKKLCNGCGKCVDLCEGDVFYGSKKGECPSVTYPEECWHDGNCVLECPIKGAIRLRTPLPMMLSYK